MSGDGAPVLLDDFADFYGHLPVVLVGVAWILENFTTGDERTWDEEAADIDLSGTRASFAEHGIVNPVTLGTDGRVLDGHHRLLVAREEGVAFIPSRFATMPDDSGFPMIHWPTEDLLRTAAPALVRLRAEGYSEFPPAELDQHFTTAAGQIEVYAGWLVEPIPGVVEQIVALSGGRVVGHVAVCRPHPYLAAVTDSLGCCLEVSRLFVDPLFQGHGIGGRLLAAAVSEILDWEAVPVLAVLEESKVAQSLYRRHGWVERARFDGVQGLNLLMVREAEEEDER